jgi:hypothetical protein
MNIIQITEDKLRSGELVSQPHQCAELRAKLSGEYSFWAGQLGEIEARKPLAWNAKRTDFKSDSACDKWWESTPDGINEIGIRITIKRIERMMQGLNGLLRLAEGEAKNNF